MSIKIIDKFSGQVIMKIMRPNGKVIYQTMPECDVGKDATKSVQHQTLGEARKHIGQPAPRVDGYALTVPKKSYPHNQKGYDPHSRR